MSATLRGYDWARAIVRSPSTLTAKARAVAWVLADHAGVDGHCHLLQETIAREAGWSDRAVRQGIAELCAAGLLEASRTRGASRFTLLQTGTTCRSEPDETGTTCRTQPPETGTTRRSDRHHVPVRPAPRADRRQPSEDNPLKTPPQPPSGGSRRRRDLDRYDDELTAWSAEHFPGVDVGYVRHAISDAKRAGTPIDADALRPHVQRWAPAAAEVAS